LDLFDAIVEADAKIQAGTYGQTEEQKLQRAIGTAIRQIRPVTIEQLRRQEALEAGHITWSLRLRRAYELFVQTVVFVICFLLIIVIVPLTTYFNRLSGALVDIKTFEDSHYFQKLHDVQVASKKPERDQQFQDGLRTLIEEDSKLTAVTVSMTHYLDPYSNRIRWREIFLSFYPIDTLWPSPKSVSVPLTISVGPAVETPPSPLAADILFARSIPLNMTDPAQLQSSYIAHSTATSFGLFLGGSILPFLYGFLGASVYLLRNFLSSWSEATTLRPGASAFLRLGLGGIAGLAIGWFATPDATKLSAAATQLTTTPFALAFLAGFSIELLFSLLDRLIAAFSTSPGGPAPPGAP
jgi:hypothetical protein